MTFEDWTLKDLSHVRNNPDFIGLQENDPVWIAASNHWNAVRAELEFRWTLSGCPVPYIVIERKWHVVWVAVSDRLWDRLDVPIPLDVLGELSDISGVSPKRIWEQACEMFKEYGPEKVMPLGVWPLGMDPELRGVDPDPPIMSLEF